MASLPPTSHKEAKAALYFWGGPVQGSLGIDASFAGRVLEPFQSMVMTDYADRFHGLVGTRGTRSGEAKSRLLLTALPRGSFGLELTRAENEEIFEEEQLAETLAHVTSLVGYAARSDQDFAKQLDDTAPRVIQKLRAFLEVVSKGKAGLRLETGDYRCSLTPVQAEEAFQRVAATVSDEETVSIPGIFKGGLLGSWKFDFVTDEGRPVSGKIDDELTAEQVERLTREFINKPCLGTFLKTTVRFKNGRARTTHVLMGLGPLATASA